MGNRNVSNRRRQREAIDPAMAEKFKEGYQNNTVANEILWHVIFEEAAMMTPGADSLLRALSSDFYEMVSSECYKEAQRIRSYKLGDASTAFAGILRCMIRQCDIVEHQALPIEIHAGACRVAFEADQRVLLMTKDSRLIAEFVAARWFEELDFLNTKKASRKKHEKARLKKVQARIVYSELKRPIAEWTKSAWERSLALGRKQEYEYMYALLSCFSHASPLLCCGYDDLNAYKIFFRRYTHLYAYRVLGEIRHYVKEARAIKLAE